MRRRDFVAFLSGTTAWAAAARAYFAAGGLGILIGDGQLSYQPEKILEALLRVQPQ
jgi:high affinity Mn2+ porin